MVQNNRVQFIQPSNSQSNLQVEKRITMFNNIRITFPNDPNLLAKCVECSDTVDQGEAVDMTGDGFDLIGIYCESCANEIKYVAEMDDRQHRADRGIWED